MNLSYKEEHEKFVSDHEGASILEASAVSFVAPLCVVLRNVLINWLSAGRGVNFVWLTFSVDFLCLIMSVLCAFTVLSSHLEVFYVCLFVTIACFLLLTDAVNSRVNPKAKENFNLFNLLEKIVVGKKSFLTNWRANVNVAAAVTILAVDFVIFPRKYCKAETYGTGLMDIGVGAFVMSNAVVSPEARGKYKRSVLSIVKAVKSTFPLWVLGFVRLISVKSVDYQEHTSEYGVHWNFFFTLAVVRVFATTVYCIISPDLSWLLALLFSCGYQYLLSGPLKLSDFILMGTDGKGSRDGFLNANREGLFSCLGYLAIYFVGVEFGKFLFKPRYFLRDWLNVLVVLVSCEALSWLLLSCLEDVLPVSRRLANLTYVIWIIQFNFLMFIGFLLADILDTTFKEAGILIGDKKEAGDSKATFSLLEAMNRNGLLYFLLANLFTGLINMSMRTIHMSAFSGFTVVYLYLLLLSCIVSVLHLKDITVKFW